MHSFQIPINTRAVVISLVFLFYLFFFGFFMGYVVAHFW